MTDNEDLLSDFVKALDNIAESGDFTNLVENMMDKLTTKDLLYEPMKELGMKVLVSIIFVYFHIWLPPDQRIRRAIPLLLLCYLLFYKHFLLLPI